LLARVAWARPPWIATLRPNVFKPADPVAGRAPVIERPAVTVPDGALRLAERREEVSTGLPELSEAELVVSGGRGLKGPEIFKIADYGIVGDLFEVVPALTEEFKKLLGK